MKKDVFISYSSKESTIAYTVKGVLEENGISCWMAPESIAPGANYLQEIPDGIENCKVFLILLSKAAQESTWVQNELAQAASCGKTIIPFMIKKCDINKAFSFALSSSQRMDAYENMSKKLEELVSRIKGILSVENKASAGEYADENKASAKIIGDENNKDKYDDDIFNTISKSGVKGTVSESLSGSATSNGSVASNGPAASNRPAASNGPAVSNGPAASNGPTVSSGPAASNGQPSSSASSQASAKTKLPIFGGTRNAVVFVIAILIGFPVAAGLAVLLTTNEFAPYWFLNSFLANFLALFLGLIATITALFGKFYRTRLAKWCYFMNAIATGVMYTEFCRIMEGFRVWVYLLIAVVWFLAACMLFVHYDDLKQSKSYGNYLSCTFFSLLAYPLGFIIYVIFAKLFRFSEGFWLTTTSVLVFLVVLFISWGSVDHDVK